MIAAPGARPSSLPGRWLVAGALVVLAALSWYSLVAVPMPMPGDEGVRTLPYLALTFLMWLVMMIAMMTPSVTPAVLLFDRVQRHGATPGAASRTAAFVAGYFSAWATYSAAVTVLQALLIEGGAVDTMGATTTRWATTGLLLGAAAYQCLPAKEACLQHCRAPAEFIAGRYRRGISGAWRMGLDHGLACVGCCWALMLLLFVGGVMNLAWVGGLTFAVLLEKLAPSGRLVRWGVATALVVAAIANGVGHSLR